VAAGSSHTLALKQDGSLWAWGSNYDGQLGNGSLIRYTTPIQVQGP
jgi:alpha-tubulin suppressor-like RCC1 family protein